MAGQFGIDPLRTIRGVARLPGYFRDRRTFRRVFHGKIGWLPCLHESGREAGAVHSEYFWQDLYVARKIYEANPAKHVDIGSRIDGFVAHVASFREIEVIDVRPLRPISGVVFRQVDLTTENLGLVNHCDSLSCLHALEHIGLGRYGDAIEPAGYQTAFRNMARMLTGEGMFYLSVPVGLERVEFNGMWVFDPLSLMDLARQCSLNLVQFAWCPSGGPIRESCDPEADMSRLALLPQTLGIFVFQRPL
ncbi:MAG: DUF268 domain-containing protein [Pseudomonadota bacterium]